MYIGPHIVTNNHTHTQIPSKNTNTSFSFLKTFEKKKKIAHFSFITLTYRIIEIFIYCTTTYFHILYKAIYALASTKHIFSNSLRISRFVARLYVSICLNNRIEQIRKYYSFFRQKRGGKSFVYDFSQKFL